MIDQQTLKQIEEYYNSGDLYLNADEFSMALESFHQAAALIPEPRHRYEIALPVFTAIGETYYFAGQYEQALDAFRVAANSPGGVENPLTHLRLGQVHFELGDLDQAADELTRGYMLGGRELFEGEDDKYLAFLSTRITL